MTFGTGQAIGRDAEDEKIRAWNPELPPMDEQLGCEAKSDLLAGKGMVIERGTHLQRSLFLTDAAVRFTECPTGRRRNGTGGEKTGPSLWRLGVRIVPPMNSLNHTMESPRCR